MIRRVAGSITACLLALLLVVPPPMAWACGPDFSLPIYTNFTEPDDHAEFAKGKLGLVETGYYHLYLFEAYRNLSGKPFNQSELTALQEQSTGFEQNASGQEAKVQEPAKDWQTKWRADRAVAWGEVPKDLQRFSDPYGISRATMQGDTYVSYYNCLNGAFESAVRTLQSRVKQFGTQSAPVKDWIAAQDQVFANCSGDMGYPPQPKAAIIPAVARAEDPAIVRADRAYQIAAAYFYAGNFDAAQKAFEDIAKDSASEYRKVAPYLIARVLIRKGTLATEGQFDAKYLGEAEAQLRAVLADANEAEFHPAAQRLLGFVRIRLHRQERLHELEAELSAASTANTASQDLTDYLWLLDRPILTKSITIPSASEGQPPQKGVTSDEASKLQGGDMTDWIFTFHQQSEEAYQHSLAKWHETKSLPWLVSTIAHMGPNDAALSEVLAAASRVAPDSPAYVTVNFHRLRLMAQSGLLDAARRGTDTFLAQQSETMPISARNEFLALRMNLAASLTELLRFAPRISTEATTIAPTPEAATKSAFALGSPEWAATQAHLDSDASLVFTEKLPLRLLVETAKSDLLPKSLRADVAIAAWTRAIELKNDAFAREVTPILSDLVPELKDDLAEYSAAQGDAREFAPIFVLLRNPGFRPFVSASPGRGWFYSTNDGTHFNTLDEFGDNWWCRFLSQQNTQSYGGGFYYMFTKLEAPLKDIYPDGKVSAPDFLSAQDKDAAANEFSALAALPAAPRWLGRTAIDWANAHPDDSRVPEALHNVVRAWRYGRCGDDAAASDQSGEKDARNYSKEAFEILHKRYPDNEWTKKTPYWFE